MSRSAKLKSDWYELDNNHLYYGIGPAAGDHLEAIRFVACAAFGGSDENPITIAISNGTPGTGNEWEIVLTPDNPSMTVECGPRAVVTAATGMTSSDSIYGVPMAINELIYFRIGTAPARPLKYDGTHARIDWTVAYITP